MRFLIAGLALLLTLPAVEAKTQKGQCKSRCGGQYKFCLNRAHTKQARRACKLERNNCKGHCG